MNCSMALEASELERNKVFGSAIRAKQKGNVIMAAKAIFKKNTGLQLRVKQA